MALMILDLAYLYVVFVSVPINVFLVGYLIFKIVSIKKNIVTCNSRMLHPLPNIGP
jgi:hypothetical protein